jgi:hypothetical protein
MGNRLAEDNVDDICAYVVENSIDTQRNILYFKSAGNWIDGKKSIFSLNVNGIKSCSIFTPTGNGFGANCTLMKKRPWSITHHCLKWTKT